MYYYAIFNKNYGGYAKVKTKRKIRNLAEAEKLINPWEQKPDFVPSSRSVHYVPVICLPIPAWKFYAEDALPWAYAVYKRFNVVVK